MQVAFKASECRPYRGTYLVQVMLKNPLTEAEANLESVVDTGFDGSVVTESGTYFRLGFELLEGPQSQFPVYRTFGGNIVFRSSRGKANVGGRELEVEVLTPLHGSGKNLIGRRLLGEFTTVLHGSEMTCIGTAQIGG